MTKIAMPVSRIDLDAPAAAHFAKARWLVVVEAPDLFEFMRNEGFDGRSVAADLAAHGCTDVVSRQIGCRTYPHVIAAGMRAWEADGSVTPRIVAERLASGALLPLVPDDCGREHGHRTLH